jgi:hypothetical protein
VRKDSAFVAYHENHTLYEFHTSLGGIQTAEGYDPATLLAPTGASLASCGALRELRIRAIHPMHLVATLGELLPTLSNTADLSQIVLDAVGSFWVEADVDKAAWNILDTVLAEHAERMLAKRLKQRLTLRFRTEMEGAVGEHDGWARELASLLVYFPKVGNVEYESKQ